MTATQYPMERARGCPFDPPPALGEPAPIAKVRLWDGSTPWLVTRYEQVRELLADPRLSAEPTRRGFPHLSESAMVRRTRQRTMIARDDPEHTRQRRMVTSPFAVRRVEALRPAIQRIVDEQIDALLAGPRPADLVRELALPVPSRVICELLGVPYADHERFQRLARALLEVDVPAARAIAAQDELHAYLERAIAAKLDAPAGDVLSKLAAEQVATGALSRLEAARIATLLLVAGHETTANMIALGTLALLEHPDQLAALRDDPALVPGAVEELLRYLTIAHMGRRRVALSDIEVDGVVIRAGDGVVLANDAADRDPARFPDPGRLDVQRDARGHLAFGFGVHQCLGQPLARVELQVVYGTLYRRIPGLRLAVPRQRIRFKRDAVVYGVYELPVTW